LARRFRTVEKIIMAARTGKCLYLPFWVPRGVATISVKFTKDNPET
jgi:hypothetical protein